MTRPSDPDEIESQQRELFDAGLRSSFRINSHSFRINSHSFRSSSFTSAGDAFDDEIIRQWAEIQRLPTFRRSRAFLLDELDDQTTEIKGKRVIDVAKLGAPDRHLFIECLIKKIEADNRRLLQKLRRRTDKAGIKLPTVELRYHNLCVEAECKVVDGKPLPTLWNSLKDIPLSVISKLPGARAQTATIGIVNNVSGIIKPGRFTIRRKIISKLPGQTVTAGLFSLTLLLGPPGCGKTSLLSALSGNSSKSLKVSGDITYNGYNLREFVPQKSSVYVSQFDLHMPEMTVRETIDFSARCQGVGSRTEIMVELCRREKEAGVIPDPEVDAYMKATSTAGLRSTLQTDYILKILGLDICADTIVGNIMIRGISGGQKKRLTTGEMIVGPTKVLLMDEITNGLDSSTAYQIVACIQQFVHLTDATALAALLQPAPEAFELFDDIILMAEGKIVYHGPRSSALDFFEDCGFRCPQRKGIADFLQEVISRKDQMQYWFHDDRSYKYVSVDMFQEKFIASPAGKELFTEASQPYHRTQSDEKSISFDIFSLSNWELFKACMSREFLLMKRNAFLYIFRNVQLVIIGSIAMTLFLRTRMGADVLHANYYMGVLFFGLIFLIVDGFPEAALTVIRLPVFFKQRDLYFYPAWAYAIPAAILKIPLSIVESLIWTSLTYYVIGYSPEVGRFFRHFLILCVVHFSSLSLFRFIASFFQTMVASSAASSFLLLFLFIFGGFVIPEPSMPDWLKWAFWVSPLSYGEIGISVNEFLAPRWQKPFLSNITVGQEVLESRGLDFTGHYYWISIGALIGFALISNIGFTLSLTFLKAPGTSAAIISRKKLSQFRGAQGLAEVSQGNGKSNKPPLVAQLEPARGKLVLPFEPLTVAFRNINYYIDTPVEMKEHGFAEKRCQLLKDISGAFRPGVLSALMGVSGAGKTTMLDVLSGRKTTGYTEGDIRIGGFPKVQDTFARVSGYCEQADIHSPQITVEESVVFSAWLRLSDKIDSKTRADFVNEVLETIELFEIKDSLVGIPGENGLSTEQRKRLTLAVELVANPSIVFMDEPTTGLDARAAAIVMRAVKNVADTGRTVVCTIHQPSIDIFEAFDELLLLKTGGQVIYSGLLGQDSQKLIEYLEQVPGVPKIKDGQNPAAWMLDLTSASKEAELEVDFAQIYQKSHLNQKTEAVVQQLSSPLPDSKDLQFPTRYARNGWQQFRSCLWKQHWSYWRSPSYNLVRLVHTFISSLIFGLLFWQKGQKLENQQSVFTVFGSMFSGVLFLGINHCANVLPHISAERTVVYRERFAGMYTSWAYSCAQVAIELPYLFIESLLFTMITYPMIGYFSSAYKIFWYFYTMFCTLAYFCFLGRMMISVTPNFQVAVIISSAFYSLFNLFAGFLAPKSFIPKWWIWLFYLSPTSWSLNGMLTSQYGDVETKIEIFGKSETVAAFLKDYFGYQHDQLWLVAIVLLAFPLTFATLFAVFMERLNFQRR